MIRSASILLIFAGLTAVVGAQGPKSGLTAAQQQQLFQRNRSMIQSLVDSTVDMSSVHSGNALERAKTYRKVIVEFQRELGSAADSSDATRIAELGNHLDTLMRQGMAPSLKKADQQIGGPTGSGYKDLIELRDRTVELVDWLQGKARNQWADTPEVREVIRKLELSKKELNNSVSTP
jgi:hypothetical protein